MPRSKDRIIAIKLDVDTLRGYREGTPRLLDLLERRGIKISAFFSFGPDNSGKAIRRIFRRGFISKMLRTKAPSTYGIKTMMYGTILPAPMIVKSDPQIFAKMAQAGHDCGVHAWDHVYVQDGLKKISEDEFVDLFDRAAHLFKSLSGCAPSSYAAPGWQETSASRRAIDRLGLAYTSSSRGRCPYWPVIDGVHSHTLEIPTTLPTMDEIYGTDGANDDTIPGIWADALREDAPNVLTIHTEMEGMSKIDVFDRFIETAISRGYSFVTLRDAFERYKDEAEPCAMEEGYLPGRAGSLAIQGGAAV